MKQPSSPRINLLFVCSKNRWRSPTAEAVYRDDPRVNVRSRGTASDAANKISRNDLQWADRIMVMEPKHKQRLQADYPGELRFTEINVLDIPDDYQYMEPELVKMVRAAVEGLLA